MIAGLALVSLLFAAGAPANGVGEAASMRAASRFGRTPPARLAAAERPGPRAPADPAPPSAAEQPLGSCSDPWERVSPRATGVPRLVHPDVLRERFAAPIAARAWPTVVAGYTAQIDTAFARLGSGSGPVYRTLRESLRATSTRIMLALVPALALPVDRWADTLAALEVNQFRPVTSAANRLVVLQSSTTPLGMVIDTTALSPDERRVICWSAWSLYRLYQNVNFETLPAALVRVEAQTRRWERYRADGPMQLPHELLLNRIRRAWLPARGSDRFNPPRWELVAAHPFGALELARTAGRVERTESLALEVAGATVWINDWRQHVGGSFVLAYDRDGRIGRGVVLRGGGYLTAGVVHRREAAGVRRTALILVLDVLRLLKPDAATNALRQAQGVAGEILGDGTPR